MVCFGYEAGGNGHDASCDIVVFTIDANGVKTEECWYKSPFCGMIHDCGITENYLVLPLTPLKCSLDRLKRGGNHWAWDADEDQWYGVVPRRGGKPEDIIWFRSDNGEQSTVSWKVNKFLTHSSIPWPYSRLLRRRGWTHRLRPHRGRWKCLLLLSTRRHASWQRLEAEQAEVRDV